MDVTASTAIAAKKKKKGCPARHRHRNKKQKQTATDTHLDTAIRAVRADLAGRHSAEETIIAHGHAAVLVRGRVPRELVPFCSW